MLKHHADAKHAGMGETSHGDLLAAPTDLAGIRLSHPIDDFHQSGFAGAVLAKHRVDVSALYDQRYRIVGYDRPIGLGDAVKREQGPVANTIHACPARPR